MKNAVQYLILVLLILNCAQTANQQPIDQREENGTELWMIRYNRPVAKDYFVSSTSPDGFLWKTSKVKPESEELYVYYHLKLKGPVEGLTFDYNATGDASLMPISLLDAAANELWRFDGQGGSTKKVELNDLKVRGQIVFRIGSGKSVEWPAGWSHAISNLNITVDNQKPVPDSTGFILVDNITEFRGYAGEDHVKIRLKPGTYQIDKAFCTRFIEFTGQHSYYDLKGVSIMVDTKLFSQTSLARGSGEKTLYCVLELLGDHSTMEGLYIETYGDQPGIQSKNKVFNITGTGVTLRNAELRTSGSSPWGYGSFYGLGGGDVRKMNGIRVGWPAKDVKLIGCRVHMRAMGHAIFVQGAENTLIEDCHVDGLLRTTDDILAEISGYAFDRDFKAGKGGYVEGVTVAEDGKFLPGEMFSLSEDGIRMYPMMGREHLTGSTRIINCTVDKMRRGICTGLSTAGDMVINSQVTNCIATGFNVGNSDTLINCRADALYAEAFCIPYTDARNAMVDMEILDSRRGMKNNLLAKINGTGHRVMVRTSDSSFIPDNLAIELSTPKGYGTYSRSPAPNAENIRLSNQTPARVLLLPGTMNVQIESEGKVEDKTILGCFPGDLLPEYISPLTAFGQRSEWSHDGRKVYFVDKAGGEVWMVDVETKKLEQITEPGFRPEGHGYYRVYELANGDLFFTCGPERHELYMQILKKGSDGPAHTIHEKIDEGPAISRTDMKIVWTPDQKVIYSGRISNGKKKSSIEDKTLIINNNAVVVDGIKYDGILEPQNFRPPEEKEVIWTQYGNTEAGLFTSETMGYNLETGQIVNYSLSPDQYSEPEGMFPGGAYTLIEGDRHSLKGVKSIDLYKLKLDGVGEHVERLTYFNDIEGYKASNGVVSDDGRKIAFQAANAKSATGVGCGIYLFDMEKWKLAKTKR